MVPETDDPPDDAPTNVVLITLDCVRPEALSCYPERFPRRKRFHVAAETPHIDRLADEGVRYTNATCQAPFTPASHASILTGLNPYNHGIRQIVGHRLDDGAVTLAEGLRDAGYRTGGFIGAHALDGRYGLDRGFDIYDEEFEHVADNWKLGYRRPCEEVVVEGIDWLRGVPDEPSFLFLHFFDAHDGQLPNGEDGAVTALVRRALRPIDERLGRPLEVRKGYGHRFQLRQTARIDRQIGRLRQALQEIGQEEETFYVVLADHGDAFGEHGEFNHREYLYDTTVRIPMIVRPNRTTRSRWGLPEGDVDEAIARSIDVPATVADSVGRPIAEGGGTTLLADRPDDLLAYSETRFEEPGTGFTELRHSYAGLRGTRWKFIVDRLSGSRELYDLDTDPVERNNLADSRPGVAERFETALEERLAGAGEDVTTAMSDEDVEAVSAHLEELGYL